MSISIGNTIIFHGDCRDILPLVTGVDCVITDPPYGLGTASWDSEVPLWALPLIRDSLKDGGSCYWFGIPPNIWKVGLSGILDLHRELIWDHGTGYPAKSNYRLATETILFMGKGKPCYFDADSIREEYAPRKERPNGRPDRQNPLGKSPGNVLRFPRPAPRHLEDETAHPHAKPIKMLERFVVASVPLGGVVLDPFMGVASVGVACVNMNRGYIGIEQDVNWFDLARSRIELAYQKVVHQLGQES